MKKRNNLIISFIVVKIITQIINNYTNLIIFNNYPLYLLTTNKTPDFTFIFSLQLC